MNNTASTQRATKRFFVGFWPPFRYIIRRNPLCPYANPLCSYANAYSRNRLCSCANACSRNSLCPYANAYSRNPLCPYANAYSRAYGSSTSGLFKIPFDSRLPTETKVLTERWQPWTFDGLWPLRTSASGKKSSLCFKSAALRDKSREWNVSKQKWNLC